MLATICRPLRAAESLVLADMRERLGLELPIHDTLMICPSRLPEGLMLRVEYNTETAQVSHLGVALFDTLMQQTLHPDVWRAAERIFLQLMLLPTERERTIWLKCWDIRLMAGTRTYGTRGFTRLDHIYPVLRSHTDVEVLIEDERIKLLLGNSEDAGLVRLSLPKNRELLQGTDKKEADERLQQMLQNSLGNAIVHELPAREELLPTDAPMIWRQAGDALYINSLSSDGYFCVQEDSTSMEAAVSPLWVSMYPCESMRNLLLGWYQPDSLTIDIQHQQYGGRSQRWRQSWTSLFDALTSTPEVQTFATSQCQTGDPMCTGILVVKDNNLGIANMLLLTAPVAWLGSHESIQLEALLFTNIPHANLYSLFR